MPTTTEGTIPFTAEDSVNERIEQLDGQLQLVGTLLEEILSSPPKDGKIVLRKEVADMLKLASRPTAASAFCTRGTFSYFRACCHATCRIVSPIGPTDN